MTSAMPAFAQRTPTFASTMSTTTTATMSPTTPTTPATSSARGARGEAPAPAPSGARFKTPPPPAPRPAVPRSMCERMALAKDRIRQVAQNGERVRSYEVALDLDMSEFHFARQFRAAFGCSPHVFYDEIRAKCARELLASGLGEGEVARRIGFRRPAELRALLEKRTSM